MRRSTHLIANCRLLLLFSTAVFLGGCTRCVDQEAPPQRILLVVMDGARADYSTADTMPRLFEFMSDAVHMEYAYSPSSWTLPSHASLFTGLYPQEHGVFRLPYIPSWNTAEDTLRRKNTSIDVDNVAIPETAPTLAEHLAQAGFQTFGVFGNPCYGYPIFNLKKGFDRWVNVVERKRKSLGLAERGFYSFDYELNGRFTSVIPNAHDVVREAKRLLAEADPARPLFLFLNFEDPIATIQYAPPEKRGIVTRHYKRHLEKSMTRIDAALPPILEQFRDGVVIVTSDHGQGDGSIFDASVHASSLQPAQTRIPMMLRNVQARDLDPSAPIDLTAVMNIVLETAGLPRAGASKPSRDDGANHASSSQPEYAFSHLDLRPEFAVGERARYSVYARKGWLVAYNTKKGWRRSLRLRDGDDDVDTTSRKALEEAMRVPLDNFISLERRFPTTAKKGELERQNLEHLKRLGYVQ